MANDRLAPEDGGVGIDDHAVADSRVAFGVADDLTGLFVTGKTQGTEGHPLVEFDAVADPRCLANHDAGAVIDEESPADGGAGMDVDAGLAVRILGHHPRNQRDLETIELVCHTIDRDSRQTGVAKDDLVRALGGRVAVERCLNVFGQGVTQFGKRFQEADHDRLRLGFEIFVAVPGVAVVAECAGDLLCEPVVETVDQVADVIGDVAEVQVLPPSIAWVEDLPQVGQDINNLAVARQRGVPEVVDGAAFLVGLDDPLRDRGEGICRFEVRGHRPDPHGTPDRECEYQTRPAPGK